MKQDIQNNINSLEATPEIIYLQREAADDSFVEDTWCEDEINDTDVKYIRADIATTHEQQARREGVEKFSLWLDKDTKWADKDLVKEIRFFRDLATRYLKDESVTACRVCNHEKGKLIDGVCGDCL